MTNAVRTLGPYQTEKSSVSSSWATAWLAVDMTMNANSPSRNITKNRSAQINVPATPSSGESYGWAFPHLAAMLGGALVLGWVGAKTFRYD